MFVSGFTIAKNAVRYDYPLKEAILSILPVCDEMIVSVGDSDDGTLELVQSIDDPKIKIIRSVWDESIREGGRVLALETDKAFAAINPAADWAFYIQADECVHEKHHPALLETMKAYKDDRRVEGLLFDYVHFYGSYDYIGNSPSWYKKEVRIIRNDPQVSSYKDAQGFRRNGKKLNVVRANAEMYHYGWVKHPRLQKVKNQEYQRYWHDDKWMVQNMVQKEEFDYTNIDSLTLFNGSHPQCMQERIKKINWHFEFDISINKMELKNRLKKMIYDISGWEPGEYKNYRLLRK